GARSSVTEVKRDRIFGLTGLNPDGTANSSSASFEFHYVTVREEASLRQSRADDDRIVPGQFADWLRAFLQPAIVGEPAIPDRRVWTKYDFDVGTEGVRSIRRPNGGCHRIGPYLRIF